MSACNAELCPMWTGDGCPCDTFGLDREDLPTDGVFSTSVFDAGPSKRCYECRSYYTGQHFCYGTYPA